MGTRKMFVWIWIIVGVICSSLIAGGCAMPTTTVPTTPVPTQAPTGSAIPNQPVVAPSDLLPSTSSGEPSGSLGLTPVSVGSKYGYIDSTGKLIINPQFDNAEYFDEGLAAVRIGSPESGKWGFIDQSGKLVINPQFDDAKYFSEGLAAVRIGNSKTGKWGFIDQSGKFVINPQYEFPALVSWFSEGLAWVKIGEKWGYIDKTGKLVINPQFDRASSFSEGLAGVIVEHKYGFIDKTGSFVINPQFDSHEDDESWNPGFFSEGLAGVSVEGKYGYIDKAGSYVINPQFDGANPYFIGAAGFSEDLARVCVGRKYGFIDKTGSYIINPQFDWAGDFSEGLADVNVGSKYGFIDKTGSYVINLQFDIAHGFSEGLAWVSVGDKWGCIDKTPGGRLVWNPDNIQLASEPSPQPSSPGPTIPSPTQASSEPQSENEQEAAIANALVDAFNMANPEIIAEYVDPYYRDDAYLDIMLNIFELKSEQRGGSIYYSYDDPKPCWKAGTVKLVGFIRANYLNLRVKVTGIWNNDGTSTTKEYWIGTVNTSGKILIQDIY